MHYMPSCTTTWNCLVVEQDQSAWIAANVIFSLSFVVIINVCSTMYFLLCFFEVVIHIFCSFLRLWSIIFFSSRPSNNYWKHYTRSLCRSDPLHERDFRVNYWCFWQVARKGQSIWQWMWAVCICHLDRPSHLICVQKTQAERLKMNVCYICSVSRSDIEKLSSTNGFDQHKTSRHNLLSYVRFIFYIRSKNPNHLTGLTR